MGTCEVCGRTARADRHPCRFAKGCRCWYGEPCDGSGKVRHVPRGQSPLIRTADQVGA